MDRGIRLLARKWAQDIKSHLLNTTTSAEQVHDWALEDRTVSWGTVKELVDAHAMDLAEDMLAEVLTKLEEDGVKIGD